MGRRKHTEFALTAKLDTSDSDGATGGYDDSYNLAQANLYSRAVSGRTERAGYHDGLSLTWAGLLDPVVLGVYGAGSGRTDMSPDPDYTTESEFILYRIGDAVPIEVFWELVTYDEFSVEVSRSSQSITIAAGDEESLPVTVSPPAGYGFTLLDNWTIEAPWR